MIVKIAPRHAEMANALTEALALDAEKKIDVIDLGCGTGTIALAVKRKF